MVKNYSSKNTALLIVDPFNEMIFYQRVVNYGFFRKKPSKVLPDRKPEKYIIRSKILRNKSSIRSASSYLHQSKNLQLISKFLSTAKSTWVHDQLMIFSYTWRIKLGFQY